MGKTRTLAAMADGVGTSDLDNGAVTPVKLSTGAPTWTSGGNLTAGTNGAANIISSSSDTQPVFRLTRLTLNADFTIPDATQAVLRTVGAIPLVFATNSVEGARVDTSGNFMVGTTGAGGRVTAQRNSTGVAFGANLTGNADVALYMRTSGLSSGVYAGYFEYNGGAVGSILCNSTSTSFATTSDVRLKTNIVPAGDSGASVDAIRIVKYDWKIDGSHSPFGVIAQDLHAVAPFAVKTGDEGEEVKDAWGVDFSKLVPMLIKEVQSLRARVASLEAAQLSH